MKLLNNIISGIKIYSSLRLIKPYKSVIDDARARGDFEEERRNILICTSMWGKHIAKMADIHINVVGKENIPESGPVVFVANHQGYADIISSLVVLDKFQFGIISKSDLQKLPIYGEWVTRIRGLFINRDDARASLRTIDEAVEQIKQGFSILIFPEGTRSKGGHMQEFKKGSLRLATKSGAPVIPITINNSYKVFEEKGEIIKGIQVDYIIHEPIETKDMDRKQAANLAELVQNIVSKDLPESAKLLLEEPDAL